MPTNDLDQIRSAANHQGTSLQSYLRDTVHAQATYLRRQAALTNTAECLLGQPQVPENERRAVLDAIADAHAVRAEQLSIRPTP
ncbi:MAG: hypothetical protein ACRDPW_01255 [Mycobacteriales bacterium]